MALQTRSPTRVPAPSFLDSRGCVRTDVLPTRERGRGGRGALSPSAVGLSLLVNVGAQTCFRPHAAHITAPVGT